MAIDPKLLNPNVGAVDQWGGGGKLPDWYGAVSGLLGGISPAIQHATDKGTPPQLGAGAQVPRQGAGQRWERRHRNAFEGPTNAQGAYDASRGAFQNALSGGQPRFSRQAYQAFQNTPGQAGLDPYYKDAWSRTANRINQQFGARGAYNSSAAMGQLSDAARGLGAEQANREAQYALDRAQLGGQLAGAASGEMLTGRGQQLSAANAFMGAGSAADQANLAQLLGGGSLAFKAQEMEQARRQQMQDERFRAGAAAAGILNNGYEGAFASDADAFAAIQQLGVDKANIAAQWKQTQWDTFSKALAAGASAAEAYAQVKAAGKP